MEKFTCQIPVYFFHLAKQQLECIKTYEAKDFILHK